MSDEEINKTGILISVIHRYGSVYINRTLKDYDISSGQHAYLLYVNSHKGCNQEDIARHFKVDKANITRAVRKLVNNGYIVKKSDDADSRANILQTTGQGKQIVNEIESVLEEWNKMLTKNLNKEQKKMLIESLETMAKNAETALDIINK